MADLIKIVVGPIVQIVLGKAASLIQQNFELLQAVKDDVQTLSSKLTAIQSVVKDAEDKQLNNSQVKDWLGKLQEAASDAEDALETFATEAWLWKRKQQVRKLKPPLSATKIASEFEGAKEIKNVLKQLDKIAQEKEQFHFSTSSVDDNRERSDSRLTSSFVVEADVVGREDDKNKIVDKLISAEGSDGGEGRNISCFPIIGMGGLGKTTLAQLVYNDHRVREHFEFRMWVCVAINFNYRLILKEMLQYHTEMKYDINSLSNDLLHVRLLDFLSGKRFLLVLDDVWNTNYADFEPLLKLLGQGGRGSNVLVTSRNIRVAEVIGTQPAYVLDYLPEPECWSLFEKIAFEQAMGHDVVRRNLESIGREIVKKCGGLPLAVKAMGGLLRGNNNASKWSRVLKDEIWEAEARNTAGKPNVLPALKLSYDHLPSHLKRCFAYCYIFPKASVFSKSELVKLWKAQSFIHPSGGGQDTVNEIGGDYFDELLMRSFFQLLNVDDKQRYRMHDLIHDLAQSVSFPHCYQVKDNNESCDIPKSSHHVSFLCSDVEKPALQVVDVCKRVRTLLFPTEYQKSFGPEALDKLFRGLKYIRTLDLSSSTLTELPNSVGGLKLLHYLDLSKTEIKALPNTICSLYNLETLKLLGCLWLSELPKDLGDLVNLQHLELDDMFWSKSATLPPRLGSLTSLQNLHAFHTGHMTGYRLDELKDMNSLKGTLRITKLENAVDAAGANLKGKERVERLVLEWSDNNGRNEANGEEVLEELQPHSGLKRLQLSYYKGTRFPSWIRDGGSIQNLVSLSLNHCSKCRVLSLGQLPNLLELNIKGMLELEEWPRAEYPSLRSMKINTCPKLIELPRFLPALRAMKIKSCASLKTLPVTPSLGFIKLVDNLILEDWNEKMFRAFSVNDQGEMVENGVVPSFFHLLELKIVDCPKLKALPEHMAPQKLEISGCPLLRALPIPELSRRLQHLAIDSCVDGTLVGEIPESPSLYSLVISNISGVRHFPKLPHLPGLKALHIRRCDDLVSLSKEGEEEESSLQGLPSLQLLSVRECPRLVTLQKKGMPPTIECLSIGSCHSLNYLGPDDIPMNLTSLRDLYLDECSALRSLPEEGLPSSLRHLHIEGCPLLLEQCREDTGPYWTKIARIPDLELGPISSVPKTKPPSAAWYRRFVFHKGETSKGKRVQ